MNGSLGPLTELPASGGRFPGRLRALDGGPKHIFLCGEWEWVDRVPCAAVVGTRYPSAWGERTAFELAGRLAESGWGVVSGLALGIDSAAHRGALDKGGLTGATLPGGLNRLYPPENRELAAAIVNGGGFLLSEYPPDTEARPEYFKARDRLQSGLAAIVIVIETEAEGGTMHTARFALDQGRPLWVFSPPAAMTPQTEGNRILAAWPEVRLFSSVDVVMDEVARFAAR